MSLYRVFLNLRILEFEKVFVFKDMSLNFRLLKSLKMQNNHLSLLSHIKGHPLKRTPGILSAWLDLSLVVFISYKISPKKWSYKPMQRQTPKIQVDR